MSYPLVDKWYPDYNFPEGRPIWKNPASYAPLQAGIFVGGYAGFLGSLVALNKIVAESGKVVRPPVHARFGMMLRYAGGYGAVGATFALVQSAVRVARNKKAEDFVSSFSGGAAAGLLIAARRGTGPALVILPLLTGLTLGTVTFAGTSLNPGDELYGQTGPKDTQKEMLERKVDDLKVDKLWPL